MEYPKKSSNNGHLMIVIIGRRSIMLRRTIALLALVFVASVLVYSPELIQAQGGQERGQKLYMQYCASCHGVDGKGGGVVAPELKTMPTDLTRIPKVDGKFPALKVHQIIAGEVGYRAHGAADMPVWGQVFRRQTGDRARTQLDIHAIANYLESIQVR